jgi:hypothetical protein
VSAARDDELIYEARPDRNPGIAFFQFVVLGIFTVPILVTLALSLAGLGIWSYAGGVVTAFVAYRMYRRNQRPRNVRLWVRANEVHVADGARSFTLPLAALDDVTLEKREIKKHREGTPILPELMMVNASVDAATEIVRITLVGDDTSFTLTEEWQPYSAGLEGMGKVRVFLRKHGWVPPSERWGELPEGDARRKKKRRKAP